MTDDLHNLEERFKRSAEDFELSPSMAVWENVDRELNGKRRRSMFLWLFIGAGLLLTAGGAWWMNGSDNTNEVIAEVSPVQSDDQLPAQSSPVTPKANNTERQKAESTSTGSGETKPSNVAAETRVPGNFNVRDRNPVVVQQTLPPSIVVRRATTAEAKSFQEEEVDNVSTFMQTAPFTHSEDAKADTVPTAKAPADSLFNESLAEVPEDSTDAKRYPGAGWRFRFAAGGGPSRGFTRFGEQGGYSGVSAHRNETDKELLGWNAYVHLSYNVLPLVQLYAGINVTHYRESMFARQVVYRYDTAPDTGPGPLPPAVTMTEEYVIISTGEFVTNSFTYAGVPVGLRVNVLPRTGWNTWVNAEIGINRLVRARGYLYDDQLSAHREMRKNDLQPWKMSCAFGVAVERNFGPWFSVEVNPAYRIFTGSVYNSSSLVTQKFSQAEVNVSLRYLFAN